MLMFRSSPWSWSTIWLLDVTDRAPSATAITVVVALVVVERVVTVVVVVVVGDCDFREIAKTAESTIIAITTARP